MRIQDLPSPAQPWPSGLQVPGRLTQLYRCPQVTPGLYAKLGEDGSIRCLLAARADGPEWILWESPTWAIYETNGYSQEWKDGRMEDFGGRIEADSYPATQTFEQWQQEKLAELCRPPKPPDTSKLPHGWCWSDRPGQENPYRPPQLFLCQQPWFVLCGSGGLIEGCSTQALGYRIPASQFDVAALPEEAIAPHFTDIDEGSYPPAQVTDQPLCGHPGHYLRLLFTGAVSKGWERTRALDLSWTVQGPEVWLLLMISGYSDKTDLPQKQLQGLWEIARPEWFS